MLKQSQAGFTLIELILVVAVLTILTAAAAPFYLSLNGSNELDAATSILTQDLYQAQSYSRNQTADSAWGVAVKGQVITLFSGNSYASRNAQNDVVYKVPNEVLIASSGEIIYSKLYGLPVTTGSFSLTSAGRSSSVLVNNKGMVEY